MITRETLISYYNATSGNSETDEIETYQTWLEDQLIKRENKFKFNTESELLQCIYKITPIAIPPKINRNYQLVNSFSSSYAYKIVCETLAKNLFKKL